MKEKKSKIQSFIKIHLSLAHHIKYNKICRNLQTVKLDSTGLMFLKENTVFKGGG